MGTLVAVGLEVRISRWGLIDDRHDVYRLRELYGNNQSFQLSKTEPHGLTINIRIPLEVDEQAVAA